jgi:hypothetical protein
MSEAWSVNHPTGEQLTNDARVARLAARQHGVVTFRQLLACGLTRREIEVRVRLGHLHPLHRGVYAVGHPNVSLDGRFLAAVMACGSLAVLSHFAAAVLRQLLRWDGRSIDVTAPTKRTHPGIKTHRATTIERSYVNGIPVTPKLRTIIDLSRTEDDATVKRALRQAKLSESELARLPRRLQAISPAPTASPLEDIVLDLILKAGFVHPEVNAPYVLPDRIVYPDLRWPQQRLIVEVDSREWHSDPFAQREDARRQADLEAAGERVLRVTHAQATAHAERTLARLRAAGAPYA